MSKLYIDEPMKNLYEKYDSKNYFSNRKLKVLKVDNATILPPKKKFGQWEPLCGNGGIIDCNGDYVSESAQTAENMSDRVNDSYKIKGDVEYIDEAVIYANHFIKHWGHFLVDVIGRLWYKNNAYKYVFTADYDKSLTIDGTFLEFLNYLGISENDIIIINKPTKFKKVIIPESSIIPGKYYTKEYTEIFNAVIANCPKKKTNTPKIYFSRKNFNRAKNKETGEEIIEDFFTENKFSSISPEKLSLKEQINYIQNAKVIVAISGTLPQNIMFAKKNTKIIILNKTYSLNYHIFLLNQASEADVTFVDVHKSLLPVLYGYGPFIIKFTDNLKNFARDNKYILNVNNDESVKFENIKYILKYVKMYKGRLIKDKNVKAKTLYHYYRKK